MKIQEVMTRNVEFIDPNTTLKEAAGKMKKHDIGALPIGENDKLIGMLTDRDIAVRSTADGRDPNKTKARDVMSPKVVYCYDDQDLSEAASLMKDNQVRRLVVLNRDKRMVGICSLGNLVTDGGTKQVAADVLQQVSHAHN